MTGRTLPSPPRAILLDVGGTLLAEQSHDLLAGARTFLEGSDLPGRPSSPEELESWLSDLESVVEATRILDDREFSLSDWLRSHLPVSPADVAVAELAIWVSGVVLTPVEGAREALERIHAHGIPVAVLSNTCFSGRTLEFELRRQGFGVPFEFVMTSADCGRRKPDAQPFLRALSHFQTPADQAWYVGDSWEADVVGAAGVGMTAVWLAPTGSASDATRHHRAASWKEATGLLEAALGGTER
ncbi:MAG: HAD family hydrolase [Myxococcota bacterium]